MSRDDSEDDELDLLERLPRFESRSDGSDFFDLGSGLVETDRDRERSRSRVLSGSGLRADAGGGGGGGPRRMDSIKVDSRVTPPPEPETKPDAVADEVVGTCEPLEREFGTRR